jgi:hypothetical protein
MPDPEIKLFNEDLIDTEKGMEVLFEQYKLYVESMDKVSDRRHNVNTFFLSLNSILVTGLTIFLSQAKGPETNRAWILIAVAVGIASCVNWRQLLWSYGRLNQGKFIIIHHVERKLPARLYDAEWDVLRPGEFYKPFTQTEVNVPLAFIGMYLLIAVFVLAAAVTSTPVPPVTTP